MECWWRERLAVEEEESECGEEASEVEWKTWVTQEATVYYASTEVGGGQARLEENGLRVSLGVAVIDTSRDPVSIEHKSTLEQPLALVATPSEAAPML